MEATYEHYISSRGWHVYGKTIWRVPKKGERLYGEKEKDKRALVIDPYAVAWMRNPKIQTRG